MNTILVSKKFIIIYDKSSDLNARKHSQVFETVHLVRTEVSSAFEVRVLYNSFVKFWFWNLNMGSQNLNLTQLLPLQGLDLMRLNSGPPIHDLFQIIWSEVMTLLPKRGHFREIQTYVYFMTQTDAKIFVNFKKLKIWKQKQSGLTGSNFIIEGIFHFY